MKAFTVASRILIYNEKLNKILQGLYVGNYNIKDYMLRDFIYVILFIYLF